MSGTIPLLPTRFGGLRSDKLRFVSILCSLSDRAMA